MYDLSGNIVWKKNFGGSGGDYFYGITAVTGGFVAVGYSGFDSFGNGDWIGITNKGGEDAIIVIFTLDESTKYTITYNLNGGTGTVPTQTPKAAGETFTASPIAGITAPTGKMFKEWNTASNGLGTAYAAGANITMPANNITLYAIWQDVSIIKYTVTYNLNGGTGTVPTQTPKAAGETFAASSIVGITAPSNGHFKGWNTKSDGTGNAYAAGATVTMPANNLTLYATWEAGPPLAGNEFCILCLLILIIGTAISFLLAYFRHLIFCAIVIAGTIIVLISHIWWF